MLPSYSGRKRLEKIDSENVSPHLTPWISVSVGEVFCSTELKHEKRLIKKVCMTDHKQLSVELCDHASRSLRPRLIRLPFEIPQEEISFDRVGSLEVTTALIPLTDVRTYHIPRCFWLTIVDIKRRITVMLRFHLMNWFHILTFMMSLIEVY